VAHIKDELPETSYIGRHHEPPASKNHCKRCLAVRETPGGSHASAFNDSSQMQAQTLDQNDIEKLSIMHPQRASSEAARYATRAGDGQDCQDYLFRLEVAAKKPSSIMTCTTAWLMMSLRNCSCCKSSRARRVGPGYLEINVNLIMDAVELMLCVLQILQILLLLEILKIFEIGNKFLTLEILPVREIMQVMRITETLHELCRRSACQSICNKERRDSYL
jgi:hypothetical protein